LLLTNDDPKKQKKQDGGLKDITVVDATSIVVLLF
jgi:hypothetical protein